MDGDLVYTDIDYNLKKEKELGKYRSVCYIILTCEKYLNTRAKWQKNTCFKQVPANNYYYISCKMDKENRIFGWDTNDDYDSCITKYIKFFQNMDIDYDWYVFLDDDTFVFPNRIEGFLSQFEKEKPYYIGSMWSHLEGLKFMSGGAGFVFSKPTYKLIRAFFSNPTDSMLRYHPEWSPGDVSIGVWIREINRRNEFCIHVVNEGKHLKRERSESIAENETVLTFHYVNQESHFQFHNNYLVSETCKKESIIP